MKKMQIRKEFGTPIRGFEITLSLKEGYGALGHVHELHDVRKALKAFSVTEGVEISGTMHRREIFYAFEKNGDMIWCNGHQTSEPGVVISGLFPPNKFGEYEEDHLVALIGAMIEYLARATGQISVHAEVCGKHYAWIQQGQTTAREDASAVVKDAHSRHTFHKSVKYDDSRTLHDGEFGFDEQQIKTLYAVYDENENLLYHLVHHSDGKRAKVYPDKESPLTWVLPESGDPDEERWPMDYRRRYMLWPCRD
jgi:hypothetical protein